MQKKISINILTWNSEEHIETCLKHSLSQDFNDYEVVVIDNNSSDNTLKICSEYSNCIRIIRNNENLGYCGGHNVGIRNSSSEYILVLNPDVYLEKNYLINIINFLDSNLDYGGAIGKILQFEGKGNRPENELIIDTTGLQILKSRQLIARNYGLLNKKELKIPFECFGVDGMAAVYRRSMLEQIKINFEYFDEDFFAYCEDQDLSWRARKAGWRFAFINESMAFHVRTWKPKSLKYRRKINCEIKRIALRNHYLMVLKNEEFLIFLLHFPHIIFRFIKIFIYSIFFEKKTLLALYDFLKLSKNALCKRKILKTFKKVSITESLMWFKLE